jgi:hypothetical protein
MPEFKLHPLLERAWLSLKDLLTNPYFGYGLLGLTLFIGTGYIVFDKLIMPNSVGHDDMILVPNRPKKRFDNSICRFGLSQAALIPNCLAMLSLTRAHARTEPSSQAGASTLL